jgi:hypothetical protein
VRHAVRPHQARHALVRCHRGRSRASEASRRRGQARPDPPPRRCRTGHLGPTSRSRDRRPPARRRGLQGTRQARRIRCRCSASMAGAATRTRRTHLGGVCGRTTRTAGLVQHQAVRPLRDGLGGQADEVLRAARARMARVDDPSARSCRPRQHGRRQRQVKGIPVSPVGPQSQRGIRPQGRVAVDIGGRGQERRSSTG